MIHVGILLYNDVEVLDFAGPFEVFAVTEHSANPAARPFLVQTVSEAGQLVTARNGLKVQPDYSYDNAPRFDILIVPGGPGSRTEMYNKTTTQWVKSRMDEVSIMASVCTGALILAEAGLLDGKTVTTHWNSYDRLEKDYPNLTVKRDVKYVDEGNIVTSGGISAGINMSFHLVSRLLGRDVAERTAKRMEYDIDLSNEPE
ncbi:AraC family transcriptional regulator [Paenibacillus dendritiformis]|uniref:DJ-1/PfpI family protein n=1 Tax=Paenibacillus dendritiformis TaxID=130049 RepID=UPI00143CE4A3|nr:DJ-1/PfpI family protein [Paenibacillus dendritiformis]NKI19815.1 DJ-1/PfpI family protein [Paenibacillus dendritiformis]NRF99933.1 DJ-1/PfpI family protein [Paenibacillus dendritiformis]GIO70789.1 AraC family transcriptional regulator [Paenibacillus dendritiformis]